MDGFGFVAEESDRLDVRLDLLWRRIGVVGWGWERSEEFWGRFVDAGIGGLGAEDGGDEELVGVGEGQLAVRIGVVLAERVGDFECSAAFFFGDLRERERDVLESSGVVFAFGMNFGRHGRW